MRAKSILGGDKPASAPKQAIGSGTKISGYVESPQAKKCGTCEYRKGKNLCRQSTVLKDSAVPTDKKTGLKIVSFEDGCCDFWVGDKK